MHFAGAKRSHTGPHWPGLLRQRHVSNDDHGAGYFARQCGGSGHPVAYPTNEPIECLDANIIVCSDSIVQTSEFKSSRMQMQVVFDWSKRGSKPTSSCRHRFTAHATRPAHAIACIRHSLMMLRSSYPTTMSSEVYAKSHTSEFMSMEMQMQVIFELEMKEESNPLPIAVLLHGSRLIRFALCRRLKETRTSCPMMECVLIVPQ